jgi:hypothetical protein
MALVKRLGNGLENFKNALNGLKRFENACLLVCLFACWKYYYTVKIRPFQFYKFLGGF